MSIAEKELVWLIAETLIQRLRGTYGDFFQERPGFADVPDFFRNYIYLPQNKEKRDIALEKLHNKLKAITGPKMSENVGKLIHLSELTDALDKELATHLLQKRSIRQEEVDTRPLKWAWNNIWGTKAKPKVQTTEKLQITEETLLQAIKETGQAEQRTLQIELICEILTFFFSLSRLPAIRLVLAPIKVAAFMVGAGVLIETMEVGYKLLTNIQKQDFEDFISIFRDREKSNLQVNA